MNDIGMRSTAGDYPPEHDAAEHEERRLEALCNEARELAEDAARRGKWEPVEKLLGFAWLYERQEDVHVEDLVAGLIDALADDTPGSSHAPAWVRREREIRRVVEKGMREVKPSEINGEGDLPRWMERHAIEHGRMAAALEEIGMILGETK